MKAPTVKTHPLAEILARGLSGIEGVPQYHRGRMIHDAIKKAVKYHDKVVKELEEYKWKYEELCK